MLQQECCKYYRTNIYKMKIVCVVVFVVCLNITVLGAKTVVRPKEIVSLIAEQINYGDKTYLDEGTHKKISCKGSQRSQKLEWYDPSGEPVKRDSSNRVFVQEQLAPSLKSKSQTLVLVFTHAAVQDSGIWECRSQNLVEKVPICVLEPATFIETPEEVSMDGGRSISLSCQSRGDPEPKIMWYRNEELLSDEDDDKVTISTKYNRHSFEGLLTIQSLTAEDSGEYLCVAVQEVPGFSDCSYTTSMNITLNVNFPPEFETQLETTYVFAQDNESVNLICAPHAHPKPTFRWFRKIGEMLTEYPDKQFSVSDDGTQSILTLIANSSTFEQKFRCSAKNGYGEAINNYQLRELTEPAMLSEVQVYNVTYNMILFNVTWNKDDYEPFPVDAFDVQYLEKRNPNKPKEFQWRKSKTWGYALDQSIFEYDDILVPLKNLKEGTEYWVRIRAVNEMGEAPWSTPIASGTVFMEEIPEVDGRKSPENILLPAYDFGMFLGFFLTAVIVIFAAVCIFIIKRL